ncbi:MAG: methyltransferase domain-containing protein [Acidobacteria bacterium]|nr:methyltransferase domain-containing protein [Acidobacteriota bacterium]
MPDEREWPKVKSTIYSWLWKNPASNSLVVALAHLSSGDRTLDIGCGPGAAVRRAARIVTKGRAVGVDRSQAMVAIARRRAEGLENVEFEVGAVEALPFPDDTFTVVWTVSAFHHWTDPVAGLEEIRRVLTPGGRLIIVEAQTSGEHGLSAAGAEKLRAELLRHGWVQPVMSRHQKEFVVSAHAR